MQCFFQTVKLTNNEIWLPSSVSIYTCSFWQYHFSYSDAPRWVIQGLHKNNLRIHSLLCFPVFSFVCYNLTFMYISVVLSSYYVSQKQHRKTQSPQDAFFKLWAQQDGPSCTPCPMHQMLLISESQIKQTRSTCYVVQCCPASAMHAILQGNERQEPIMASCQCADTWQ